MTEDDIIRKDPDSVEPYWFDWSAILADLGEGVVITDSEWIVSGPSGESPVALAVSDDTILTGGTMTQAWFSGGTARKHYRVTNRIRANTTPEEFVNDRTITFHIVQQ